jgi:hypothetical protein
MNVEALCIHDELDIEYILTSLAMSYIKPAAEKGGER